MSTVSRGVRNAFRNTIRTGGVTIILALSVGLALVMLLSLKTVQARIASVKASIGNTISISPAGARGFEGGGQPLTQANVTTVQALPHVKTLVATLSDRLTPSTDTSLVSAIDPGTLGQRFQNRGFGGGASGGSASGAPTPPTGSTNRTGSGTTGATTAFQVPIQVTGATQVSAATIGASSLKFTSGAAIAATGSGDVADVGTALATKNSLKVGSTFTAYSGTKFTVAGIYDAGNTFSNAGLVIPLATEQKLSGQTGDVSSITVTADDISNVSATVKTIQSKLGSGADVVSQQDEATNAITPLQNIQTISLYSLIGALAAGAIIIFLTMMMIVRERRREIGVLKAIGASNFKITTQFVVESLTLTTMGGVLGVIGGYLLSNPVLQLLVNNSTATATTATTMTTRGMGGGGFAGGGRALGRLFGGAGTSLRTLHAVVGYEVVLYGLAAALVIAIVGSALPAWLIARVRPAEVMRGE